MGTITDSCDSTPTRLPAPSLVGAVAACADVISERCSGAGAVGMRARWARRTARVDADVEPRSTALLCGRSYDRQAEISRCISPAKEPPRSSCGPSDNMCGCDQLSALNARSYTAPDHSLTVNFLPSELAIRSRRRTTPKYSNTSSPSPLSFVSLFSSCQR